MPAGEAEDVEPPVAGGAPPASPGSERRAPHEPLLASLAFRVALVAVAVVGIVGALLGRAVEPALPGVWLHSGGVIRAVKLVAGVVAQLFAIGMAAVAVRLVIAVSQTARPAVVRVVSIGVTGLVVMAVMSASAVRLPDASAALAGVVASLFAVVVMADTARIATLRAPALALGVVGIGALARAAALGLNHLATRGTVTSAGVIEGAATLGTVAEAVGVGVAAAWLFSRGGRGRGWRLSSLGTLLAGAAALTYAASYGKEPEAWRAAVLLGRMADAMLLGPDSWVPPIGRTYLEMTAWLVAVSSVVRGAPDRVVGSALALVVIARTTVEAPLCALALVVAALTLTAHPGLPPSALR